MQNKIKSHFGTHTRILLIAAVLSSVSLAFQNCDRARFSTVYEDTLSAAQTICNPLDSSSAPCNLQDRKGLVGNLYYLSENTPDHVARFGGGCWYSDSEPVHKGLCKAVMQDYFDFGYLVKEPVVMSEFNITPRPWDSGFITGAGKIVQTDGSETLLDFFALDLHGFINLPAGNYQFAIVSDDGMKVFINNNPVIVDDGIHSPRWKCTTANIEFDGSGKKLMRLNYFQGPRVEIAMQLLYRPSSSASQPCNSTGGWSPVPAEAFSY